MKILLFFLLCSWNSWATKQPEPPAKKSLTNHQKLALDLIRAMKTEKSIDENFNTLIKHQLDAMNHQLDAGKDNIPPEFRKQFIKEKEGFYNYLKKELSYGRLEPQFMDLYTREFTEQDLAEALKFYRSPAGRKLVEKNPKISRLSMDITQNYMQGILPEMMKYIQGIQERLEKTRQDLHKNHKHTRPPVGAELFGPASHYQNQHQGH